MIASAMPLVNRSVFCTVFRVWIGRVVSVGASVPKRTTFASLTVSLMVLIIESTIVTKKLSRMMKRRSTYENVFESLKIIIITSTTHSKAAKLPSISIEIYILNSKIGQTEKANCEKGFTT